MLGVYQLSGIALAIHDPGRISRCAEERVPIPYNLRFAMALPPSISRRTLLIACFMPLLPCGVYTRSTTRRPISI